MSLPHAILTALIEKPSSGLELARRFDRSIGYFWSATHQQIYRELTKLADSGFIRARTEDVTEQGHRKTFDVLPAGREELQRWVREQEDPRRLRDPLMLRLRAAAVVGTDGLTDELERHRELHQQLLAEYLEIEARDFADTPDLRSALHHLILRRGIEMETSWTQWLSDAIDTIRQASPEDTPVRE